jgi:transposase
MESSEKPSSEVARELGVRRNQLYKWKEQLGKRGAKAFGGPGRRSERKLERVKEERDLRHYQNQISYFPGFHPDASNSALILRAKE